MTFTVGMINQSFKCHFNVSFSKTLHYTLISQSKNHCQNFSSCLKSHDGLLSFVLLTIGTVSRPSHDNQQQISFERNSLSFLIPFLLIDSRPFSISLCCCLWWSAQISQVWRMWNHQLHVKFMGSYSSKRYPHRTFSHLLLSNEPSQHPMRY